jgi:acetyl esterase/lipase
MGTYMRFAYGTDPAQIFDHYFARAAAGPSRAHLVLVHGGGWAAEDPGYASAAYYATRAQALGMDATCVGYRGAGPGVDWAVQVADIETAVARVRAMFASLAALPLLLWGESAGGHLAAVAALRGVLAPVGLVCMYGAHDLTMLDGDTPGRPWSTQPPVTAALRAALGGSVPWEDPARAAAASPVDLVALCTRPPKTLLVHSTDDPIIGIEQSRRMAAVLGGRATVSYVELPGAHHGDAYFQGPPASDAIVSFLSALAPVVVAPPPPPPPAEKGAFAPPSSLEVDPGA